LTRFKPDLPGVLVSRKPLIELCGTCGDNIMLLVYVDPATGTLKRIGVCEKCQIIYGTIDSSH
jgi:hypothetical protein